MSKEIKIVNLKDEFSQLNKLWENLKISSVDNIDINIAKLKGEFKWHFHEKADEIFWVIKGKLTINLKNKKLTLKEGELVKIPKKTEHLPQASKEAHIVSIKAADSKIAFCE